MKLMSLFSGLGAFEYALKDQNLTIVGYSEIDKVVSKAYSLLHDVSESKNLGDITKIDQLPSHDIMTYGFPCQTFSVAGGRQGFRGSNLFFEAMRLATADVLIAENVEGLLIHDKGKTLATVLETLESKGYTNSYAVLNAANFGCPQYRQRIFIVSIKGKAVTLPTTNGKTSIMNDIVDYDADRHINPKLAPYLDTKYHQPYKSQNGIIKVFDGVQQGYFSSSYLSRRLYSVAGLSPTVVTNTTDINFFEIGGQLTASEVLLTQGFEDAYPKLQKQIAYSRIYKMCGNSIAVPVLKSIFSSI